MLASSSFDGTVLLWEITSTSPESKRIAEDVNNDGVINIVDLTLVASNFGKSGTTTADVNGDGVVNIVDLTLSLVHLVAQPPPLKYGVVPLR